MVGQVLTTRDLGTVSAGSHRYTLDASNLGTGVYFCTLTINGGKFSAKMIKE
jgi:hypothetical protein